LPGGAAALVGTCIHTRQFFHRYAVSCTSFQDSQLLIVSAGTSMSSSSHYDPILTARSNNQRFVLLHFLCLKPKCRSKWPCCLRSRSVATHLLRLWVRIPPWAWMSFRREYCVLSDRGLCDELITRPEEPYRLWCVVVCDLETS
jgi:hypothetical protein